MHINHAPDTRVRWPQEACHFHGWVEAGETRPMGAARECFEEGHGVIGGGPVDLWRALLLPDFYRTDTPASSMFFVSLGEMREVGFL